MKTKLIFNFLAIAAALLVPAVAQSEILAMLNYESKPTITPRREGIAVIDVDPQSPTFKKILMDIPLPPDLVAHHIFYNKNADKAYITALGSPSLQVMDMKKFPYRLKAIDTPECKVGEDVVFSNDNKTWYLTCMGTNNVMVGDAETDTVRKVIDTPASNSKTTFIRYPHGIGLNDEIDRIIVTSTVRPSDLGDPGETVTVIEAGSGNVLSTHKLSDKPSPSGASPVEAVFLPHADPPMAYINVMFGGTIWAAVWNNAGNEFTFKQVYDFNPVNQGVVLEVTYNEKHDRMFVTTAKPGYLNIFDISQPEQPKLIKAIPTAGGAHHIVLSPDERYAFVQNSFLNLPEMDDGSISVIDLEKMKKVASIDTLKDLGFSPNCILLLPEWHHDPAH